MKIPALLPVLFCLSITAAAQEAELLNSVKYWNNALNRPELWQNGLDAKGIAFFPGLYLSKKRATYITFGFMVNNEETAEDGSEDIKPSIDGLLQTATLLRTAFLVRRNRKNIIVYFDYNNDDSWGLSVKLKY